MTGSRKVRGLFDSFDFGAAEASGEKLNFETPSIEYVPGMGLGASKQATRWAWLGYQLEMAKAVEIALKRPAHRPRKNPLEKIDAIRAYHAWIMCRNVRRAIGKPDAKITNRELIRLVQKVEQHIGVDGNDRLFRASERTNEQSLSRGRALLEIDENWNSEVCEKLRRSFAQTT